MPTVSARVIRCGVSTNQSAPRCERMTGRRLRSPVAPSRALGCGQACREQLAQGRGLETERPGIAFALVGHQITPRAWPAPEIVPSLVAVEMNVRCAQTTVEHMTAGASEPACRRRRLRRRRRPSAVDPPSSARRRGCGSPAAPLEPRLPRHAHAWMTISRRRGLTVSSGSTASLPAGDSRITMREQSSPRKSSSHSRWSARDRIENLVGRSRDVRHGPPPASLRSTRLDYRRHGDCSTFVQSMSCARLIPNAHPKNSPCRQHDPIVE